MSTKRTNERLWQSIKNEVMRENTAGTKSGQWSARKAIVAVQRYKSRGGRYIGPRSKSNKLHKWIQQDWKTNSGKPSHITGERYLPRKAFKALSKKEIQKINRSKKKSKTQYSSMPKSIVNKIRKYRI